MISFSMRRQRLIDILEILAITYPVAKFHADDVNDLLVYTPTASFDLTSNLGTFLGDFFTSKCFNILEMLKVLKQDESVTVSLKIPLKDDKNFNAVFCKTDCEDFDLPNSLRTVGINIHLNTKEIKTLIKSRSVTFTQLSSNLYECIDADTHVKVFDIQFSLTGLLKTLPTSFEIPENVINQLKMYIERNNRTGLQAELIAAEMSYGKFALLELHNAASINEKSWRIIDFTTAWKF